MARERPLLDDIGLYITNINMFSIDLHTNHTRLSKRSLAMATAFQQTSPAKIAKNISNRRNAIKIGHSIILYNLRLPPFNRHFTNCDLLEKRTFTMYQ